MTHGEKFVAIAENEEKIFLAGKEEGYAEGYATGQYADNPEVDTLLEQILKKQNELIGYNVTLCPNGHVTWTAPCYVSKTKPIHSNDYNAVIDIGSLPVHLTGVKKLYIWQDSEYNGLRISDNANDEGSYMRGCGTYANAYEITISSDKTIYCIGDAG